MRNEQNNSNLKGKTMTSQITVELTQAESTGGWNGCNGWNNKYVAGRKCWAIIVSGSENMDGEYCFKRKMDAVACYEWAKAGGYDGCGFIIDVFEGWLWQESSKRILPDNLKRVRDGYKGEA